MLGAHGMKLFHLISKAKRTYAGLRPNDMKPPMQQDVTRVSLLLRPIRTNDLVTSYGMAHNRFETEINPKATIILRTRRIQ